MSKQKQFHKTLVLDDGGAAVTHRDQDGTVVRHRIYARPTYATQQRIRHLAKAYRDEYEQAGPFMSPHYGHLSTFEMVATSSDYSEVSFYGEAE